MDLGFQYGFDGFIMGLYGSGFQGHGEVRAKEAWGRPDLAAR